MEHVTVVLIRNGVVDASYLFSGEHNAITQKAEKKFFDLCFDESPDLQEYPSEALDMLLEEGYYEQGNIAICLTWPEVVI